MHSLNSIFCVTATHRFARCQNMCNSKPTSQVLYIHTTLYEKIRFFDKLAGLNFKNSSMNWYSRLFNIQCRFLPVGVCWNIRLSKGTAVAKSYDSTFGSIAARSTIHFSLKCLTKPADSYKRSYILSHLKVFRQNEVFKEVQWF